MDMQVLDTRRDPSGGYKVDVSRGSRVSRVSSDWFSRRVVGWSMQGRQTTDVVLKALHMAVWRRKPKHRLLIHSDQGSQFTSLDWAAFIRAHNLEHSVSRRGNCHDNAVAASFFSSLQHGRIRRRTHKKPRGSPTGCVRLRRDVL